MSTNILRIYAAIFDFRYLCLLPPIFHIDKMTCCPVSCPVSCLFSITKFGFIFSELHILFLKSDILFFSETTTKQIHFQLSNITGTLPGLIKIQALPPSPKKTYVSVFPKFVWSSSIVLLKHPSSFAP